MKKEEKYKKILATVNQDSILERLAKLKKFLIDNKGFRYQYIENYIRANYVNSLPAKENLRRLFIYSLNASGGNNLKRKGLSAKEFYAKIENLGNEGIDFNLFISSFSNNLENIHQLGKYWMNESIFPDFNQKKLLYLSDIYFLFKKNCPKKTGYSKT